MKLLILLLSFVAVTTHAKCYSVTNIKGVTAYAEKPSKWDNAGFRSMVFKVYLDEENPKVNNYKDKCFLHGENLMVCTGSHAKSKYSDTWLLIPEKNLAMRTVTTFDGGDSEDSTVSSFTGVIKGQCDAK